METRIKKWGNSYALRIPKEAMKIFQLRENAVLYFSKEKDKIVLRQQSKREIIAEMMKGATRQEETDWGPPVGKEL